ncbi:MAG: tetratricopeptide repeat protein, partial [Chloroflexota bacterium]|nr:tetratricopeptide repeat protein [Chloroflexota bacterium]
HLKTAAYALAQSFLKRSLQLAEEIGDEPLTSVVFSNLAELAFRQGDLLEAEKQFRQSLLLAERFNDREYMSRWNSGLASVLQEQGRIDEAGSCIRTALVIARSIHNAPCIGLALVALGKMRIAQAKAIDGVEDQRGRLLVRAQATLNRALALSGLESETRSQGTQALKESQMLLKS